jgi:hypothetical protein
MLSQSAWTLLRRICNTEAIFTSTTRGSCSSFSPPFVKRKVSIRPPSLGSMIPPPSVVPSPQCPPACSRHPPPEWECHPLLFQTLAPTHPHRVSRHQMCHVSTLTHWYILGLITFHSTGWLRPGCARRRFQHCQVSSTLSQSHLSLYLNTLYIKRDGVVMWGSLANA